MAKQEIEHCLFCIHWEREESMAVKTAGGWVSRMCNHIAAGEVRSMPMHGMGVMSIHDGPIYTGSMFCCVNFEKASTEIDSDA